VTKKIESSSISYQQLAKTIDHSLLKPQLTREDVIEGCKLAKKYHTASVCVKPCDVSLAVEQLAGTDVKVGTVVGFPHGANKTEIKVAEAKAALADGAVELDMVINIGALRSGNTEYVKNEIGEIVTQAQGKAIVKVILENAYLTNEEKETACKLAEEAGADFVKTSTGFAPGGATLEDLKLMRAAVSPKVQVKAAGGVRSLEAILKVIDAGATRVGATATAKILDDFKSQHP